MTAEPVPPVPGSPPAAGGAPPSGSPYNWIYKDLVSDPNDAVGAIAYVLYKRDKIAFIEATWTAHRRLPTPDELKVFHAQTCDPAKIATYRAQGQQLAGEFLNAGVARRMREFEDEYAKASSTKTSLRCSSNSKVKRA